MFCITLLGTNIKIQNKFAPKAPYDKTSFKIAMQGASEYICGGNFFWQDLDDDTDLKEVPLSQKRIESLIKHYFDRPTAIPVTITIALGKTQSVEADKGNLFVASPIEFSHAFIIAIHRALSNSDESVLQQWRSVALMTCFRFIVCEGEDDRHFLAKQLREDFGANYVGVRQSALAKIFELVKFRTRKERTTGKLSNEQVAKLYQDNVKFSTASDSSETPASANFVWQASYVYKNILANKRIRQVL